MSNSFTPPPWEIAWYECKADQHDADELDNRVKAGDVLWRLPRAIGPISASHSHWGGTLMDIEEADAHLIAAAPMLYEAMDRILNAETATQYGVDNDNRSARYKELAMALQDGRAALKAARGES